MTRRPRNAPELTTSARLAAIVGTARKIMRKDKGLNGDLDRLPMLTWLMFLKFLDDLDARAEQEADLAGKTFRSTIESPYRWRDWAANPQGITGNELLDFVNLQQAVRPDGAMGLGLFAYLKSLVAMLGLERRTVVSTVFGGLQNRMISGFLLRDVINVIQGIHFQSSDELNTLGTLYESMLKEMRDAAGDSGEFYTPRPVVKLMVQLTNPQLGEKVLDPASGTGGFLVEAFGHLSSQVKTVEDRRVLQSASLYGGEPKPLPYLLCQMNLVLHGLDTPNIDSGNSLRFKLTEIGDSERVEVILTNPPFGGEEEKGIQGNFPPDKQTSETALLFLQLIMRKLKRTPTNGRPARAAVVVPNGILSGGGVCATIKSELLRDFNLHTIVRLPSGVFAPYTDIPSNLLFFDRGGPTSDVWYYEHPLPPDRKKYSKTSTIDYREFAPLVAWWTDRKDSPQAWRVAASEILEKGSDLDRKNPHAEAEAIHLAPDQIVAELLRKESEVNKLLSELDQLVRGLK